LWYSAWSSVTFVLYAYDKSQAEQAKWRISERYLHGLAWLGGWIGASFAQVLLLHKSKKVAFQRIFFITLLVHSSLLTLMIIHFYL
ncbi:MAG: DUF1294 domain-containing protein, partial [Acinetobacter sp.]|nr:DUF1294 domain-containing protein [Acinetobacter sp.]